jgi:hypothetical protein
MSLEVPVLLRGGPVVELKTGQTRQPACQTAGDLGEDLSFVTL